MQKYLPVLLLFFAAPVFGDCLCPGTTTQELVDQATYIFNGQVYDIRSDKKTHQKSVVFDINDTFKGKPPDSRVEVRDEASGGECAIDFHEDEYYLVYVRWVWGNLLTSRCWGTKKLKEAFKDAAVVGPGVEWEAKM